MQYLLAYPESYCINGDLRWTTRQIAVFHRYSSFSPESLWIILDNSATSKVQRRIEEALFGFSSNKLDPRQSVMALHLLVLSCYTKDWRWYLRSLGSEIEQIVRLAVYIPQEFIHFLFSRWTLGRGSWKINGPEWYSFDFTPSSGR